MPLVDAWYAMFFIYLSVLFCQQNHLLGSHHGKQRKMLNPVFSVNHMRDMLPLFYDLGHKVRLPVGHGSSELTYS